MLRRQRGSTSGEQLRQFIPPPTHLNALRLLTAQERLGDGIQVLVHQVLPLTVHLDGHAEAALRTLPQVADAVAAVQIMGRSSKAVETVLGYKGRTEMIHRDDLVLGAE